MLDWVQAVGGLAGVAVAFAAAFITFIAMRHQSADNRRAMDLQADVAREAREHDVQLAREQRMWDRRADLYSRITTAMRGHLESPTDDMVGLLSEVEMIGSKNLIDVVSEFVLSSPDADDKLDIWADFQAEARRELGMDAVLTRPMSSQRTSSGLREKSPQTPTP